MGKKASAKAPAAPKAGKAKAKPNASTKSKAGGETPEAAGGQAPETVINLVNDDVNTGHNAMVTAAIGTILAHPCLRTLSKTSLWRSTRMRIRVGFEGKCLQIQGTSRRVVNRH